MRPHLQADISVYDFKNNYWLKSELRDFCKQIGLHASGSKINIEQRIESYLKGEENQSSPPKRKNNNVPQPNQPLSLTTIITQDHRCSSAVRQFFLTHTNDKFHFSLFMRNYFKQNIGKTYQDALSAWFEEDARSKLSTEFSSIAPQFKFNQFIRDYYLDSRNKGKSRRQAIDAWNEIKRFPGDHKYKPMK
jgi:hypothetical protein